MSFFPDLTPVVNQLKEFTQTQAKTNSLLEENNLSQTQQLSLLKEIKQLLQNQKN